MGTENLNLEDSYSEGIQTSEERAAQLGIQEHTSTTVNFETPDSNDPFSDLYEEDNTDLIRRATENSEEELKARSGYTEGEVTPETFYSDEELIEAGVDPEDYHRAMNEVIELKKAVSDAREKIDKVGPGFMERLGSAITTEKQLPSSKEISAEIDWKRVRNSLEASLVKIRNFNKRVKSHNASKEKAA